MKIQFFGTIFVKFVIVSMILKFRVVQLQLWILIMSKLRGFNPFESDINCIDPQIILNPKFAELVCRFGNYVLKGDFFKYHCSAFLANTFPVGRFHPERLGITLKDIPDCYVVDMSTGDPYPMYFVVPCGKCIICTDSKINNFARRCQFESQLYDCDPIHLTMTLDSYHIPDDRSVSLRDIQLWKKRVRIGLERMNYGEFVDGVFQPRRIRICVAAEYGTKNTHRPHYHVLIWNLKAFGRFTERFLKMYLLACWSDCYGTPKCLRKFFFWSRINADYIPKGSRRSLRDMGKTAFQAFGYVAKYFYKSDASVVPPGCKPLFHTMSKSKGLGGIGAPFIDKHIPSLRKNLRKKYYFLEKFTGSLQEIKYDRYVINRVYPSKYMSVGNKVRHSLQTLFRYSEQVPDLHDRCSKVFEFFKPLFPILVVSGADPRFCFKGRCNCDLVRFTHRLRIINALHHLETEMTKISIPDVLNLDMQRKKMLDVLFHNKPKLNVNQRAITLLRIRERRRREFTKL